MLILDGYINECGKLNLKRLGLVLSDLAKIEKEQFFIESMENKRWMKGKKFDSALKNNKTHKLQNEPKSTILNKANK